MLCQIAQAQRVHVYAHALRDKFKWWCVCACECGLCVCVGGGGLCLCLFVFISVRKFAKPAPGHASEGQGRRGHSRDQGNPSVVWNPRTTGPWRVLLPFGEEPTVSSARATSAHLAFVPFSPFRDSDTKFRIRLWWEA